MQGRVFCSKSRHFLNPWFQTSKTRQRSIGPTQSRDTAQCATWPFKQ